MVGKSAHGNSGKVPHYEHGWATKRDGCLLKPAFDCAPFRVQAKLLEPAVWEEVLKLFRDPALSKALITQAKRAADERLGDSGQKRTESRIGTVTQQIEVLAERLAELPKSISAAPIYTQMEKLQAVKTEEEERLRGLKSEQKVHDLPAELTSYEALLRGLNLLKDESTRTKIIEALIHEVEITPDGFRLHYYVGKNHIEGELARRASSVPSSSAFQLSRGSNSLTNGGSCSRTNEPTEPTMVLRLVLRWTKKKIDLLELVTLREAGLTFREISARTGVARTRLFRMLKSR